MRFSKVVLVGLRGLVVIVAGAGIGLGIWAQTIIRNVESRGIDILQKLSMEADGEIVWRRFFDVAMGSQIMFWVAIGTAGLSFLIGIFVALSMMIDRLEQSNYIVISLEFMSIFAMAATFGVSLSLAINLGIACVPLESSSLQDLKAFTMLCPLSMAYVISNGTGGFLLAMSSLVALTTLYSRSRAAESYSFEPTASSFEMEHIYQAIDPPVMERAALPGFYEFPKPAPGTPIRPLREDEGGLLEEVAVMGLTISKEGEVVREMRSKRPWSELPRRK